MPPPVAVTTAVAGDAAAAAAAAAAPSAPHAGSGASAAAAPVVARASCSLLALRGAAARGRRLAVGHLLHQIEGRFRIDMFVRMDRIRRPSSTDGLRHLLVAVTTPADQLQAVNHDSRRHHFPELKFKLCRIIKN